MKKKSSLYLGIFLILAVLMLGIGYAAITNNLTISGAASASINNENFKVKFDNTIPPTITKSDESFNATATYSADLTATIDVKGLSTTHDTVSVTYTIKNESPELGAALAVGSITNSNQDYFEVTANLAKDDISASESTTLVVTVKLIKTPIEQQNTGITVPITATAVTS